MRGNVGASYGSPISIGTPPSIREERGERWNDRESGRIRDLEEENEMLKASLRRKDVELTDKQHNINKTIKRLDIQEMKVVMAERERDQAQAAYNALFLENERQQTTISKLKEQLSGMDGIVRDAADEVERVVGLYSVLEEKYGAEVKRLLQAVRLSREECEKYAGMEEASEESRQKLRSEKTVLINKVRDLEGRLCERDDLDRRVKALEAENQRCRDPPDECFNYDGFSSFGQSTILEDPVLMEAITELQQERKTQGANTGACHDVESTQLTDRGRVQSGTDTIEETEVHIGSGKDWGRFDSDDEEEDIRSNILSSVKTLSNRGDAQHNQRSPPRSAVLPVNVRPDDDTDEDVVKSDDPCSSYPDLSLQSQSDDDNNGPVSILPENEGKDVDLGVST